MITHAFDIESYYDKDHSLETFGNWNYLAHPATDVYLMAVAGENGFRWCGRPEEFDWSFFNGQVRVVSHNFAFDGCLFGLLGHPLPGDYNCTSHLAAYCGSPRSLKDAAQHLLGREVSKDLRANMKGRRWQELSTERQNESADYCQHDAELSLELWLKCADRWPPNEQELSRQTIRMGWLGVRIDRARLVEYLARATAIEQESTSRLPWDAPVRSLKHARAHCQLVGIPAPESFNQKNTGFLAWEKKYGEDHPFIAARRDCHKATLILRKLEAMQRRIKPDGRLNYNLRYGGAHTLRWSGSGGCNLQNLPRAAWNGIDLRSLLVPEPGKKFIVCDLSAIEPRVLTWLVGDQPLLELLAQGLAIYEAQALAWGLWQGTPGSFKDSEPALYLFIKSLSLGCGYGMGPRRFRDICAVQGIELSEREAVARIALYRKHNPKVVKLWRRLDRELGLRRRYGFAETVLPSGRKLRYTGLTWKKGSLCAMIQDPEKGWRETRLWGGVLTENIVSAIARDIFSEALLRLERASIRVVLHAHDEVVCEAEPDITGKDVESLMTVQPSWAQDLPLAAKAQEMQRYAK
jgi:DNA polymerase